MLAAPLLVAALALAGCGGDDAVPAGAPAEVVARAPERTRQAGPVRVAMSDGRDEDGAVVDLEAPSGRVGEVAAELLDLVATAERVESFGGQQIRGVAAFRYDVVVARGGGEETIGVWVDPAGRIRRVQVRSLPPATVRGGLPRLTIVDFVSFGVGEDGG